MVYSKGGTVDLRGHATYYGCLYAPHASVKIADEVKFYGSLVGEEVTVKGNAKIYYHKAPRVILRVLEEYKVKDGHSRQNLSYFYHACSEFVVLRVHSVPYHACFNR